MYFQNNQGISKNEALELSALSNDHILELIIRANQVRPAILSTHQLVSVDY